MKGKITLNFSNNSENKAFFEMLNVWDEIIPTCYFVDICCVGNIKNSALYLSESYEGKAKYNFIKSLERIDLRHNAISYFPALIEKVSDFYNEKSILRLKEEAREDLEALNNFFKNARVLEPIDFVNSYIDEMRSQHPESSGEKYHDFLSFVNCSGIIDPVAPEKRLEYVKVFFEEAERIKLDIRSVVFISCVACIYGCLPARRLMKFKKNPTNFNSSNALADLQSVSRIARLSIGNIMGRRSPYARYSYLTEDKDLKTLYDYFFVNNVENEILENGVSSKITTTINGKGLFPVLFDETGAFINDKVEGEFNEILTIIGIPIE